MSELSTKLALALVPPLLWLFAGTHFHPQTSPPEPSPVKDELHLVNNAGMAMSLGKAYLPRILRDKKESYSKYSATLIGDAWVVGALRDRKSPLGSSEPLYMVIDARDGALVLFKEYSLDRKQGFKEVLKAHHLKLVNPH